MDPDPLVRGTDPWIQICTKMSRIPKTVFNYSSGIAKHSKETQAKAKSNDPEKAWSSINHSILSDLDVQVPYLEDSVETNEEELYV